MIASASNRPANVDERIRSEMTGEIPVKSYKHLWEQYVSRENYETALRNATRHKGRSGRKGRRAKYYRDHMEELMPRIMRKATSFRPTHHRQIEIYDGIRRKKRTIVVPSMDEQVMHHMLVNVLKPIFMRPMYEHSYGSIPGRGAHLAKRQIERWIRHGGRNCKYVLKMDVRKFFDSVPHDKLKAMLRRVVRDERLMRVIDAVIDSAPGDVCIPIGFYTSQWFANFYLTGLDHYIKETLGAKYYVRYMDDMVIFGPNKRRLHRMRDAIAAYLRDELGLEMKSNWQVYLFDYVKRNGTRVGRDLDFMGFRFHRERVTLRRSIMLKLTRKAKRIGAKPRRTVYDARQMLSYLGWLDSTDTYGMFRRRVKPHVSFQCLRRRISRWQKRQKR